MERRDSFDCISHATTVVSLNSNDDIDSDSESDTSMPCTPREVNTVNSTTSSSGGSSETRELNACDAQTPLILSPTASVHNSAVNIAGGDDEETHKLRHAGTTTTNYGSTASTNSATVEVMREHARVALNRELLDAVRTRVPREFSLARIEVPAIKLSSSSSSSPRAYPADASCVQEIACIQMSLLHIDAVHFGNEDDDSVCDARCALCQVASVRRGRALIELLHLCAGESQQYTQLNVGTLCDACAEARLGFSQTRQRALRAYSVEFIMRTFTAALNRVLEANDMPRAIIQSQGDRVFHCATCSSLVATESARSREPYAVYMEKRQNGLLRVCVTCSERCSDSFDAVRALHERNSSAHFTRTVSEPYDRLYSVRWQRMRADEVQLHLARNNAYRGAFKLHQCGNIDCPCRISRGVAERYTRAYYTPHVHSDDCGCPMPLMTNSASEPAISDRQRGSRIAPTSRSTSRIEQQPLPRRGRVDDTPDGTTERAHRDSNYAWLQCVAERLRELSLYEDVLFDDTDTCCVHCTRRTTRYCTRCIKTRLCSDACATAAYEQHAEVCHTACEVNSCWSTMIYC
jgi:hypothetical protein